MGRVSVNFDDANAVEPVFANVDYLFLTILLFISVCINIVECCVWDVFFIVGEGTLYSCLLSECQKSLPGCSCGDGIQADVRPLVGCLFPCMGGAFVGTVLLETRAAVVPQATVCCCRGGHWETVLGGCCCQKCHIQL